MFIMQNNISHNYPSIYRYTTLRNAVACMVLIAPDGACHAFGMPAWLMMTLFSRAGSKANNYVSQTLCFSNLIFYNIGICGKAKLTCGAATI